MGARRTSEEVLPARGVEDIDDAPRIRRGHTPHTEPDPREAARWSKIAGFLEMIRRHNGPGPLRIVEIGCGRGWLTNLVSTYYGCCEGVEAAEGLVGEARVLFPSLRFTAGTAATLLERVDFQPYDVVISSEPAEAIAEPDDDAFIRSLRALLKPAGYLVLTTAWRGAREPRRIGSGARPAGRPIEERWRTPTERAGLRCIGLEGVYQDPVSSQVFPAPTPQELKTLELPPVSQVWVYQGPGTASGGIAPRFNRPPKVSVIVPTYNRPERLREALHSILAQTLQDFEIIVVNDGGRDAAAVIDALPHGGRITYVKHDRNRGLAASRNTGLRLAQGTYIAYLDDDDRFYPDHLGALVETLEQEHVKVAYTDAYRASEISDGTRWKVIGRDLPYSRDFDAARLLISNYIPVLCVMHERACLDEVGLFDETLYAHEDWDLWIRMAMAYPFLHLKRATAEFSWRTDGSSMTSGTQETYLRTAEIIYRKYRPHAERLPGVVEAQRQDLAGRRRAFEQSIADSPTPETMYQGHVRFRTFRIFREFLADRRPRTLVMGICSALGMSYYQFRRLAYWMGSVRRRSSHVPEERPGPHEAALPVGADSPRTRSSREPDR